MKEIISFWPILVVIVVFFFVAKIWMALVDGAAGGLKKLLGIRPKEITWHTLEAKDGTRDEDGGK